MKKIVGIITANYDTPELSALTSERTIASLPYCGRYRLIDFPLSNMVNSGINTVGLILPYKYRSILDHIGIGKEWSLDKKNGGLFVLPGSAFGVGGTSARFLIRDFGRNNMYLRRTDADYVVVTSANIVCNMDYTELIEKHMETEADITIVYKNAVRDNSYLSAVTMDGEAVTDISKGVKAGDKAFLDTFIIKRDVLVDIVEGYKAVSYSDMFDCIKGAYSQFKINAIEFDGYSKSIFTVPAYYDGNMDALGYDVDQDLFNQERPILTKVQDSVPTKYDKNCTVKNCSIPAGCTIKGEVVNSVLFRDVVVEEGAVVKNSVIMQNCVIKAGAVIENAIVDRRNVIECGTVLKGTKENILIKEKNEE